MEIKKIYYTYIETINQTRKMEYKIEVVVVQDNHNNAQVLILNPEAFFFFFIFYFILFFVKSLTLFDNLLRIRGMLN